MRAAGQAPPLKLYRVARRLRQSDLASASGLARETICRVERGHEEPSLKTAQALALVLDVPVGALFPARAEAEEARTRHLIDLLTSGHEPQDDDNPDSEKKEAA